MTAFVYVAETVDSVRSKIVGYAQTAGLKISNWIAGGIGKQLLETVAPSIQFFTTIAAKTARTFGSLDTATDPGDDDPYDPLNVTYPSAPGGLSDKGSNDYGTERIGNTFAVGTVTFANTGTGNINQTHDAFALTFQRDNANADGSRPLYRNSAAVSVLAGVTADIPIVAENPGTSSNASAGHVTIVVNTLPGVTITNAAAVLGTDRQGADDYRAVCREAASLTSPNGPSDSYDYLAKTGRDDGTYGNSATGSNLGITGVYVSASSSTGIVHVFYRGAAGGAALTGAMPNASGPFTPGVTTYVQAANYLLTRKPGVIAVPDAMTFIGDAATDDTVAITYAVKAKASSVHGGVPGTYTQGSQGVASPVFTAIEAAVIAWFEMKDIGGDDQAAGAGTIYADQIRSQIAGVWPTTYHTTLAAPAGDVSLALGHDAITGTFTGTVVLT